MSGRIFAVVGPSGVGKDTLMEAARAARPDVHLVRRVVTRAGDAEGEDYRPVTLAEFARLREAGAFALSWEAHGLSYGIPVEAAERAARGEVVLFNGSRAMLGAAAEAFPGLRVLHVTARPDVLRARLAARGRESEAEIAARLARADLPLPAGLAVTRIDNSGALGEALEAFLAALDPAEVTE